MNTAELGGKPPQNTATHPAWNAAQSRAQWAAVTCLRWRIFRNGLSRRGALGEWIGSLLLYLLLAIFFVAPVVGAGIAGFYMAHAGRLDLLAWLFWSIFGLTQLININLGQAGTTFDPNQLIRFPLSVRQFVGLRLFFGLLSPGNVLVALMSGAVALGLIVNRPRLWPAVSVALLVFTAVNILFSRMVFAWVDRSLSTRRAREVFTALIFIGSIGLQYLNLSVNTGALRGSRRSANVARWRATGHLYERGRPVLRLLPPELTASSIRSAYAGQQGAFAAETLGCAAFGGLFLAAFALRMRAEFRGEVLGGSTGNVRVARAAMAPQNSTRHPAAMSLPGRRSRFALPHGVLAVARKELIYARRNPAQFYGMFLPLAMTFLFARQMGRGTHSAWVFPGVFAYTLLALMPLTCNSFGLEGSGAQFYFLAPVRLREVVLGKNLVALNLSAIYTILAFAVVWALVGGPSFVIACDSLLWAAATLLATTALGNVRSLAAPKRIDLTEIANRQASPLSVFMNVGVAVLMAALGMSFLLIARSLHLPWLAPLAFAGLFAGAMALYLAVLRGTDSFGMAHRERLLEELGKA